MKKTVLDIISLSLVCAVVGGVAVFNVAQTDRPTVSETENRTLAEMPAFSLTALADGSYFKGLSAYISDTFLMRDQLVSLSKKMDTLKGIEYRPDGGDAYVMLGPGAEAETEDADMEALLNQAFENLGKTETDAPETWIPETSISETETIETEIAETNVPETSIPETETAETDILEETDVAETTSAETEYTTRSLTLSKETLRLTVGSGAVVHAYLDTDDPNPGNVKWSLSDRAIASISMNPSGGIDVKGLAAGTCTLLCRYGEEFRVSCEITITEIEVSEPKNDGTADFLTNGMFLYGDAVYTDAFYSAASAESYARTAAYYKSLFGENVGMHTVVAPVSSVVIDNEKVKSTIQDQKSILDRMAALMDPAVNFVDAYTPIYEHRDEYLYFKSDHHWTQRGAYYAYTAFAESIGLTPTPLDEFDFTIRNDSYRGSMYMYTQDERVKQFTDEIEVFVSRKSHTMTVTGSNGATYTYDSAVAKGNNTYVTFIAGDNPYTVINVPENPQDFNILVLKDSFGNAMVPFLCEHYGNIIVVDVRHSSLNIYEQLKDYGLTDILFINNIQAANSTVWSKMYLAAVGIAG